MPTKVSCWHKYRNQAMLKCSNARIVCALLAHNSSSDQKPALLACTTYWMDELINTKMVFKDKTTQTMFLQL